MRVLYLISGIGPPSGWGTEYIQNLIFKLAEKDVQVTIINPIVTHINPNWEKWTDICNKKPNIRIISLIPPPIIRRYYYLHLALIPLFVTFAVVKLLLREKFDIIHEFSSTSIILFRAFVFNIFFRVPTIFTLSVHNNTFLGKFYWFRIFNFASYYLIPSKEIIAQILKYGVSKSKVIYSPPGIDLKKFATLMDKRKAKEILALPKDKYIITFFGSLTIEKGVEDLLEAIDILKIRFQEKVFFCFFTVWKGSTQHHKLKNRIISINASYIMLVDKYIDIPTIIAAADIIVLPQQTGYGTTIPIISVLEAIVAKKLMITTDILNNREFVNKTVGILIPPKNPLALAKAMENCFENTQNLPQINKVESERVIREFDIQKSIRLHLLLYKSVLL